MRGIVRSGMLAAVIASSAGAIAGDEAKDAREAKERFGEGIVRAKAGDWEGARRSFQQSIAVMPSQTAAFNLALADEKCARPLEALAAFKDYTHRYTLAPNERAQATRHIADLMMKTGHLEVQAPTGALLTLDGSQNAGVAPLEEPLDVVPGPHVVQAKLAHGSKSQSVEAVAGQVVRVSFPPEVEESVAAPTLETRTSGGATSTMPAVASPARGESPAPSTGVSAARVVTVAALGGSAIVAGLLGVYFGHQSNKDADRVPALRAANPNCTATSDGCQQLQDALSSAHSEHLTSDGLFVAGAALAVVAIGTWILWPSPAQPSAARLRIVPVAGSSAFGALAVGAF
jgi:hypothetical protein